MRLYASILGMTDEDRDIWTRLSRALGNGTTTMSHAIVADSRDFNLMLRLAIVGANVTKKYGNPEGVATIHALLRNGFEPRLS